MSDTSGISVDFKDLAHTSGPFPSAQPRRRGTILRPQQRTQTYAADLLSLRMTLLGIVLAAVGGFALTLVAWLVMHATHLPAFSTSMVTQALATVGIVGTLVLAAGLLGWWLMDEYRLSGGQAPHRPPWRVALTYAVAFLAPALIVISAVGIPLSATRLWLDGIQVDQVFRTQFLTRATAEGGYADMNYLDMPTFYPMGWFWLGGRLAALLHLAGWEVFQPWGLISLAVAGCLLVPIWQHLVGSLPVATAIALVTTAITLTLGAEEPYSAIIAMGVPAVVVMCGRAFAGSWASTVAVLLYLGVSATFYTLFTGAISIMVVTLLGVVAAFYNRSWRPIIHLVIIGVGALAVASIAWAPYVLALLHHDAPLESAAQHYLPTEGTQIPVPFLAPSIIGLLCLLGLIYLVMRLRDDDVRSLVRALVGVYLWVVASMVASLAGTTLLGFRLEIIIVLLMATAGVLCLAEIRLMGMHVLYPARFDVPTNRAITWTFIVFLVFSGIHYAQQIPQANQSAIDNAYADTDGDGERADRYQPDSSRYYKDIDAVIRAAGHEPIDTVVMTDEKLFMAYYPYHGFNAFTSHYANPLGEFTARNNQMEAWATDSWKDTPQEFLRSLDAAKWHAPDVIIFRGNLSADEQGADAQGGDAVEGSSAQDGTQVGAEGIVETAPATGSDEDKEQADGLKIHLAEDIFPNQPNVRYRAIFYNPAVFSKGWVLKQVGPFVVAVRERG